MVVHGRATSRRAGSTRARQQTPGERPNDRPPKEWLVAQAAHRGGALAGFAAPAGPASPRTRADAVIVPCSQAEDLASEIARLWPLDDGGTALDLAVVEGFASIDAEQPWEQVRADLEARQQRHAARPAPVRAVIEAWWWCRRAWRSIWRPPPWRRAPWNWQRMRRGWSDRDTWSLDWYLAGVISGSVAHLRDHGHTYPGEENGAGEQQWHDILTRIAGPLSANWDRIIDGETPSQWRERQERELAGQQEALPLLAQWFFHLWD